MDGGG